MVNPLETLFPGWTTGGGYITSPRCNRHNCIAWVAGDTEHWWWPLPDAAKEVYWPPTAARTETLAAFQEAFASLGYATCESADLEAGFEKIALFALPDEVPLHASRQLPSGWWTSKVGELEDIQHALRDLEGPIYGAVVLIMQRPLCSP